MSNAIRGQGTLIQTTGPTLTVAEVGSIDGPTLQADTIDVTNQDSPDNFREKIQGLKDGGEVSFDINYLPNDSTHDASTGLLSIFDASTIQAWQVSFPDTPVVIWTFNAFLTQFSPASDIESQLKAAITLTISGKPVLA